MNPSDAKRSMTRKKQAPPLTASNAKGNRTNFEFAEISHIVKLLRFCREIVLYILMVFHHSMCLKGIVH